jgi:hypothetical protein
MLVRSDNGAIDEVDGPVQLPRRVGLGLDGGQEAVPAPGQPPAAEAAIQRGPGAIPFRDVPPGRTGAQLPDNAIENRAVVPTRPAGGGPFGRQEGGELLPLPVGKFMASTHTLSLQFAYRPY